MISKILHYSLIVLIQAVAPEEMWVRAAAGSLRTSPVLCVQKYENVLPGLPYQPKRWSRQGSSPSAMFMTRAGNLPTAVSPGRRESCLVGVSSGHDSLYLL